MRKLLMIILFILMVYNSYSITYVDSCQEINESILDSDRIVELNTSIINISTSPCFHIVTSNITFDCMGEVLDSVYPPGVYIAFSGDVSSKNITVKNCILTDWSLHAMMVGDEQILINNSLYGGNVGYQLYGAYNLISDNYFNDVWYALELDSNPYSHDNTILNNIFYNNSWLDLEATYA